MQNSAIYLFAGWETREKVEGQNEPVSTGTYTDEQIINTALAANGETVTLYALWEKNDYTIEYQGNKPALGSTYVDNLPGDTACKFDENVTLAAAPTLAGYTFGGWYFDSTCTRKAGDAGETLVLANLTTEHGATVKLYAKWTANTYKLIFNTNGGELTETSMTVTFDSQFTTTATPTREGHDFMGWYLPDGSELTMPTYWRYAEDVTVTAKWLRTYFAYSSRIGYKENGTKTDDEDQVGTLINPNGGNLIKDDDDVYELIDPGMDKQALINAGYTKVVIKVSLWLYEKHDGDKNFWIKPYQDRTNNDMSMAYKEFTSTKGKWNFHSWSFDALALTTTGFSDALAFYIEYGAHGNQGDNWYIGDTIIEIQAYK